MHKLYDNNYRDCHRPINRRSIGKKVRVYKQKPPLLLLLLNFYKLQKKKMFTRVFSKKNME